MGPKGGAGFDFDASLINQGPVVLGSRRPLGVTIEVRCNICGALQGNDDGVITSITKKEGTDTLGVTVALCKSCAAVEVEKQSRGTLGRKAAIAATKRKKAKE